MTINSSTDITHELQQRRGMYKWQYDPLFFVYVNSPGNILSSNFIVDLR